MQPCEPITDLLSASARGDRGAHERVWAMVYKELHPIASRQFARERSGHTLQPTALIHEVYVRLNPNGRGVNWASRAQFFAAAAKVMRRIRVDHARKKKRLKRGGDRRRVEGQPGTPQAPDGPVFDWDPSAALAIEEALERLERLDRRAADVFTFRHFGGLTRGEVAQEMGIAARTVDKHWAFARAWLRRELAP